MDLYAAFCQTMALVQLGWIKYTMARHWYTRDQWVGFLTPLLSNPTVTSVWAPILPTASTTLHKMAPQQVAQVIIDYAVGEVEFRLLSVRVSNRRSLACKGCISDLCLRLSCSAARKRWRARDCASIPAELPAILGSCSGRKVSFGRLHAGQRLAKCCHLALSNLYRLPLLPKDDLDKPLPLEGLDPRSLLG